MGKTTEDQKAFMVKLYTSGETTVQIGQYFRSRLLRLTIGCTAVVLLFEGLGKRQRGVKFVMMHSMN